MNPYQKPTDGQWYWHDETGDEYGPYRRQRKAEKGLAEYIYWLDYGPTRWQRFWWPIRYYRLWHSRG